MRLKGAWAALGCAAQKNKRLTTMPPDKPRRERLMLNMVASQTDKESLGP
jgi:hypothetical protein